LGGRIQELCTLVWAVLYFPQLLLDQPPPDMFTCHLIFLPLFVVIMIAGMLDEEVLFSNNLSLYGNLDITIWLKLDHIAPRKNHRASDY